MNAYIITHDEDGNAHKVQGTSYTQAQDKRAGFVFYTEALSIAQNSARPWSRWFPEEETASAALQGVTLEKPKSKKQLRLEAMQAIAALQG